MIGWWTIGRASGVGVTAAALGLILWPFYSSYGEPLELPFLALALAAGLCGTSILLITGLDLIFHRRRSDRLRPVRAFDLCLAAALIALSLLQLDAIADAAPYLG